MAPERTCVACRGAGEPGELVRLVVAPDGQVVVDLRGRLPGRGAWLHPRAACVEALEKRAGVLKKLLRAPEVDASGLRDRLRDAVIRAALDGLSLAAASGSVVGGHDVLLREISAGRVAAVIVASDASERTVKDLRAAAPELGFIGLPLDREALGRRVGRGARAALGVVPTRGSEHLRTQLRRLADLG